MTIRIILNRRNLLIGLAALILIIASTVLLVKHLQGQTQAKYYGKQLELLKNDVAAIDSLNQRESLKGSLTDQVVLYQSKLTGIVNVCGNIAANADKTKDDPKNKRIAEQIKQVSTLCSDMVTVTVYAQKQADATRNFVLFPADSLSEQKNVASFTDTLRLTKASLEGLKQDPINDPAVSEQIIILEQLQLLAGGADEKTTDFNALARQTSIHQVNFLNARSYYWTNTILIGDLRNSIASLQSEFNAQK